MQSKWLIGSAFALIAGSAQAVDSPSPAPRQGPDLAGVAAYVHRLENMPLSAEARQDRKQLFDWFVRSQDVSINFCEGMLLDAPRKDKDMAGDLLVQAMLSAGAFVIEHPKESEEALQLARAGLRGALLAYQATVAAEPKKASRFFGDLVALDARGKLDDYLVPRLSNCM